jgi:hypothetical protein
VQRRGAHPSERVPSRLQSLPPAFLRRPFRGRPIRAPLQRSPPPSCDACPAPAHLARRGSRGAQGSGGRVPSTPAWRLADGECGRAVPCVVWHSPPYTGNKKGHVTSPLCRRLPVCAVSGCVESAARSGSSCSCVWCRDRTIVYRRHAISGSEQTSSQLWWYPAIALRLSRSLNLSHFVARKIWRRRGG